MYKTSELKRKVTALKRSLKGCQLARNDRLLVDILFEIVDILTSDSIWENRLQESFRSTRDPSDQEIKPDEERVLRLRDVLRSRGRSNRRK